MRGLFAIFILILGTCPTASVAARDDDDSAAGSDTSDNNNSETYYPENITCAPTNQYIKCASLPDVRTEENIYGTILINGSYIEDANFSDAATTSEENWSHYRNGIPISGRTRSYSTSTMGPYTMQYVYCTIESPFSAEFFVSHRTRVIENTPAELCANVGTLTAGDSESGTFYGWIPRKLDKDRCPDGFFTVPSELWCGADMINIADTPYCNDDTTGESCLIQNIKSCNAGISTIKTSTGLSFSLYAEKYTAPALAVKYGDTICYANMELGNKTDTININYDGQIYHLKN